QAKTLDQLIESVGQLGEVGGGLLDVFHKGVALFGRCGHLLRDRRGLLGDRRNVFDRLRRLVAGRAHLLGGKGVFTSDGRHLVDVFDHFGAFLRDLLHRGSDLVRQGIALLDGLDDLFQRFAGSGGEGKSLFDLLEPGGGRLGRRGDTGLHALDQRDDLLRGAGRVFSELAHFGGYDGKTPAVFAGTGRFDRGVEGQEVG